MLTFGDLLQTHDLVYLDVHVSHRVVHPALVVTMASILGSGQTGVNISHSAVFTTQGKDCDLAILLLIDSR